MSIYLNSEIQELNDENLYKSGLISTEKSLEIAKKISKPIKKEYNIFVYWIGNNINYKHSVVLKSFLSTQNLKYAKLKIYSDVDISNNQYIQEYKKFNQIKFHIFDVEKEIIGTKYERFKYVSEIKHHKFNAAYESDFFRLLMLNKYGGFYIDFDVLLLRDLSPLLNYNFLYQWGSYPNKMINGAIMHLKKESRVNEFLTDLILDTPASPGYGSLTWASNIYLSAKESLEDLVIFPSSFFNSEWQSEIVEDGILNPLKSHKYSNMLYDGCFTWHWHNRWDEDIEEGSKFWILDNILEEKLNK